jgi:hypothetical protein
MPFCGASHLTAPHMSVIRGIFELSVVGGSGVDSSGPESASIQTQEHRGLNYRPTQEVLGYS